MEERMYVGQSTRPMASPQPDHARIAQEWAAAKSSLAQAKEDFAAAQRQLDEAMSREVAAWEDLEAVAGRQRPEIGLAKAVR